MSTEQKIIKNKVGLLKLAEMLASVSQAGTLSLMPLPHRSNSRNTNPKRKHAAIGS